MEINNNTVKTMLYSDLMIAYVEALNKGDGYAKAELEREINKRNKQIKEI